MIQEPTKDYTPQTTSTHPVIQLIIIVFGTFVLVFIGFAVAAGIILALFGQQTLTDVFSFNTANKHTLPGLWILQIVSTTVPLFVAPLLYARFIVDDVKGYLKPTIKFSPLYTLLAFAVMLASFPLMEVLTNINQSLKLPASLRSLEDAMRAMEQSAQKATEAMLHMNTVWDMLFAVFVIGLLTGIAEEFLFRGVIQTIFVRWTKNTHAAVWITAILFSAFHMEFFTFLPRVALGVFFGYFVAYSGSIWPAVWGHFLNNASAVVMTYLYQQKQSNLNPDNQQVFNYWWYTLSLIIVLFLLYIYKNIAKGKKPMVEY